MRERWSGCSGYPFWVELVTIGVEVVVGEGGGMSEAEVFFDEGVRVFARCGRDGIYVGGRFG